MVGVVLVSGGVDNSRGDMVVYKRNDSFSVG